MAEIPTGAVADLLGKRKTLILAFLFEVIGAFMMAMTPNLQILAFSVFIMCIGGAFYSGTIDALVFDTLKEDDKQDNFDKKISNINTISLVTPAICGALGGFMYQINPTWPFWANAFGYCIGLFAAFFLIEPHIDSVKFSFKGFLNQTTQGLRELFKTEVVKNQTIMLLSVGFFIVIASEMLNSFLAVDFGFSAGQLGILWSVIMIVSAAASQLTPILKRSIKSNLLIILIGVTVAITFLVSPIIGIALGGISITLRSSLEGIFGNLASITINENTDSKFRATTISTFNMIKNIPYVLSAYLIGSISDKLNSKNTALYLGIFLLIVIFAQILIPGKKGDKIETVAT